MMWRWILKRGRINYLPRGYLLNPGLFLDHRYGITANRERADEIYGIARELEPDEVQINTPLRPCAVKPLSPAEIAAIRERFMGIKGVVTVYEATSPEVRPMSRDETLRRRPGS